MANPTTYFGWVMPNSADLVTDLPADFNVFGQGVDTSMSQLLGGTTGQVLSKTSGTNMAFTWVTPTDQTPLTTKGDLFTFTTVDARLAVGNNGETLLADNAATSGLRYQPAFNGNVVINGGYDIWQRGTTFTAADVYTADRWRKNSQTTSTVSRQTTSDTTNLPTIQYCARVARNSASTDLSSVGVVYTAETADSIRFAGQAVVVSFYARSGANYSSASSALSYNFYTGTGTDQSRSFASGFTGEANIASATKTLTTTWQRFSFTATVGATATELALMFFFTPVGTAGAADYFEITGVQLELGSVATTFKRSNGSGGTIQGELAACQRYYLSNSQVITWQGNATNTLGYTVSTTFPVQMRIAPTVTASAVNQSNFNGTPTASQITTGGLNASETCTGTANAAYYQFTYTATAEL